MNYLTLIRSLSKKQQDCLIYYYVDALSQREIGERFGISKMAVCKLLRKARKSLAKMGMEIPKREKKKRVRRRVMSPELTIEIADRYYTHEIDLLDLLD